MTSHTWHYSTLKISKILYTKCYKITNESLTFLFLADRAILSCTEIFALILVMFEGFFSCFHGVSEFKAGKTVNFGL
jgi:hypothetical protein